MNVHLFVRRGTNNKVIYYVYASIILCILDILLFLIIGIVENSKPDLITGLILIFWLVLTILVFNFLNLKSLNVVYYLIGVTLLSTIEESIVYFNGGGLNGTATSLQQDLTLTVPVFVALGLALYILKYFFDFTSPDFYIYGSIFGFILEILIGGKIGYFLLFLGPALVIYGTLYAALAPKYPTKNKKLEINKLLEIVISLLTMFFYMILGAIIGGITYSLIK